MTRPAYPEARRSDDADTLHGTVGRRPVPVAGGRRTTRRREAWSPAQDELLAAESAGPSRARAARARVTELLGAGIGRRAGLARRAAVLHPPHGRAGARRAATPCDPRRHRAGAASTRWRSTRPARPRWTPGSPTRRATCWPTSCREGGNEESVLRVMDVATGEPVDGPDRPRRYSPVAWLPGGEAFYYVRRLAPRPAAGRTSSSTTAGSGCTGSAPTRTTTSRSSATGLDEDQLLRRLGLAATAAGWSVVARPRAPHRATTSGSPTCPRPDPAAPRPAGRPGGRRRADRRCRSAGTAGSTCSPTATRRAAGSRVTTPDAPGVRALARPDRRRTRGGARGLRDPRRRRAGRPRRCAAVRLDPPRGQRDHRARPRPPASASATCRCPASASVGGLAERPEGGHEAWFGYTDHVTPPRSTATTRRTGETTPVGRRPRAPSRCPTVDAQQVAYRSRGRHRRCGCSCIVARPRSRDRPAPDGPVRLRRLRHPADPGLLGGDPRLGRGRRRLRGRQPARRRRGGRGVAPRRHARTTSRTSSTTSTPRPSGWSRDGWTTTGPAGDLRRVQRRAAGRRRADPAPRPVRRRRLLRAAAGHGALRDGSASARPGTSSTAPPTDAGGARLAAGLLAVPPRPARASTTPPMLFTVFDGDTRVDPLHARKMCAALQHATAGTGPVLLRRESGRRSRRPRGEPVGGAHGRHARVRRRTTPASTCPDRRRGDRLPLRCR